MIRRSIGVAHRNTSGDKIVVKGSIDVELPRLQWPTKICRALRQSDSGRFLRGELNGRRR